MLFIFRFSIFLVSCSFKYISSKSKECLFDEKYILLIIFASMRESLIRINFQLFVILYIRAVN